MSDGTIEPRPLGLDPEPRARRGISAPIAGLLWMTLASALFALMNVLVRAASAHVPWSEVAAVRTTVGALVAVAFALGRGSGLRIHDRKLSWARSLTGTAAMLCGFYAMGTPAIALGDAVTLASTSPIFIALLAPWLLGERSGRRVWLATLLAFFGVALIAGPSFRLSGHVAVIATLGGFFSGLAMIWLRRLGAGSDGAGAAKESPEAIVAHFSAVAAVAAAAVALPSLRVPDLRSGLMLGAIGVLGGTAQLAMTRAYALEKAARLGAVGYSSVVFAYLLGVMVLDETPSLYATLGALLILGSGVGLALAAMRDGRGRDVRGRDVREAGPASAAGSV
jgi:drug/metabolite transporter (DMT)-like permease